MNILEILVNRWVAQENRDEKSILKSESLAEAVAVNKQKNFYEYLQSFDEYDDD